MSLFGGEARAVEFTAGNLRDPFTSVIGGGSGRAEAWTGGYELQGIVWNSGTPQALINGEVVVVGDRIGGAIVVSIEKKGVRLSEGGREFTLNLDAP